MTTITVSRGFHNSKEINLRIKNGLLSDYQYKRLTNHMCGVRGCICSPKHGWEIDGMPRAEFLDMLENASYSSSM